MPIARWIGLLPGPAIAADVGECAFRSPFEDLSGAFGVGDGDGGIARSSVYEGVRNVLSAGGGEGVDHVKNTGPVATAEVAGEVLWPLIEQRDQGGFMAFARSITWM